MAVPTSSAVEVSTVPTPLFTPQAHASRVTIQNLSGADMYVGGDDVSTTNGFKLSNGSTLVLEAGSSGPVYGVAETIQYSPSDTRVLIEPTN